MGKSLKGKELGKGISQRKDGLYQVLAGLRGEDIDFHNNVVHVKHSMTYFSNAEGKYVFELHSAKTHKAVG